jgi:hypothetical protein
MVLDPRKRQKKLQRKMAKRKAQKMSMARYNPTDMRVRFQRAAGAPVVHSMANDALWEEGIGHVLLSREISPGQLAFAAFLIDMYCLGVKNAMWSIRPHSEVESLAAKLARDHKIVKLKPECTRKLVEGAVEYARNLGFAPHEDYQQARLIFGSIDGSACTEQFVFGKDGKPLFIAGPNDTPARCRQIVNTLDSRLGPAGHHFLMPVPAGEEMLAEMDLIEGDPDDGER